MSHTVISLLLPAVAAKGPLGGQRPVLVEIPSAQVLAAIAAGIAILFAIYYAVSSGRPDEEGKRRPFPAGSILVSLGVAFGLLFGVVLNDAFAGQTIPIYSYGFMVMIGFAMAIFISVYRSEQVGIDANVVMDLGLWTMLAGIAGARIFHMIQFHENYAEASFFTLFEVWKGGLVFYGGMIGSLVAGVVFLRMRKISVLRIIDVIAPAVPLGIAFARFGCFLNGCCFGRSCDSNFFLAIQDPKTLKKAFIHPTQLYSSLDAFVIFVLVVIYSRLSFRRRAHGELFALFVILYGVGRFMMESFRNDTGPVFGTGGTIAQVMSVAFVVVALPWFAWLQMEKRKGLVGPADEPVETPSEDKDS